MDLVEYYIRLCILNELYKVQPDNELFKFPDARVPPSSGMMQLIIYGNQSDEQSRLRELLSNIKDQIYGGLSLPIREIIKEELSQVSRNGTSLNSYNQMMDAIVLKYMRSQIELSLKKLIA